MAESVQGLQEENTAASPVEEVQAHHRGGHDKEEKTPVMEFTGFGKAYVPRQPLCELYPGNTALLRGTIFPQLDIPYKSRWQGGGGNE